MVSPMPRFKLTRARRSLLAWLLTTIPLGMAAFHFAGNLCVPALTDEAILGELVRNTTTGRQALISSCWISPLPLLLKLPLYTYLDPILPHAASRLLPVFALSALWLLLNSHMRSFGIGRLRWLFASVPLLSAHMLAATLAGSNAAITAFFAVATMAALLHWCQCRRIRHLGALGFSLAALAGCAPTIVPWIIPLLLVLALNEIFRASRPAEARGSLVLATIPLLYAWLVWAAMSWLIMGDALFVIKSLPHLHLWSPDWNLLPDAFALIDWLTLILSAAAFTTLLIQQRWSTACLLLCAILLMPIGHLFGILDLAEADPIPLLCLLPLLALLLPQLALQRPRYSLLLPGLLLALALSGDTIQMHLDNRTIRQHPDAQSLAPDTQMLRKAAAYVRQRSEHATVFVTGYCALPLLQNTQDPLFVSSLDFNFNESRRAYYGQNLYILVHAPRGRAATDSIHWRFPDIYKLGSQSTLYAHEWGAWRLFEIIQAPIRQ
jgi:hypothetical protein